jgi:AcrR family transcriptional regulator
MSTSKIARSTVAQSSASGDSPYHHGDLRTALVTAARRTVERDGYEALSLRKVAEQVGVSSAAPYRHFKDKRALLSAVAAEGFVALRDAYRSVLGVRDPVERLLAGARAFVDFAAAQPGLFRLMFDSDLLGENAGPATALAEPALIACAGVERGVAAVLPGCDAQVVKARAILLWSTLHGLIVLRRNRRLKPFMLDAMSESEAIDALLASVVAAVCRA